MAAVITALDVHANPAVLEIGTAAVAVLIVSITLKDPSFTEASGVITMDCSPARTGTAVATNTAVAARLRTGAPADVVTGLTVGTSGTDIILNNTSITTGQTVTFSGSPPCTITHAA
jgi:hypothetical protein